MSGDYSRRSFDPRHDFSAVLMQQGRVQTDADWNEWIAAVTRRIQADSLDTLGQAVVPRETPEGFQVAVAGGNLSIGRGRMYVDGLLVENHGGGETEWDPALAEPRGSLWTDYAAQPYYPDRLELPGGGPHVVYLKAWKREITAIERPEIVEKALGVDTTTREQMVWQVKLLANPGPGISCATPLEDIPGFATAEPRAAGRLTTATAEVPGDPDPCLVPPAGGYKGLENQLYRVEIHRGGDRLGTDKATFKWSRDNRTVASRVTAIPVLDRIVVESVGRDSMLRFSDGDWIEVTDDWRELNGLPGEMRRIRSGGGVDDATRTILLESALPNGRFPVDTQGNTDPSRNTRVRRWDQRGKVRKANGDLYDDLDLPTSDGTIPVPADGVSIALEHGIIVNFRLDPAPGVFLSGDHWMFAARTADGSIEILNGARPHGIHAHYAKLAIVTFPDAETDCRSLWPPELHEGCDCSVCVSEESHTKGELTVQMAIDQVKESGGTVCLGPGTYRLSEALQIDNARSLRLRGQGWATVLAATAGGGALEVRESIGVHIENLTVLTATTQETADAIELANSLLVALENCVILNVPVGDSRGAAVGLDGYLLGATIERCALAARTGISGGRRDDGYLATASLRITDNWFQCTQRGVELERFALHFSETRIEGNTVRGCRDAGLVAVGATAPAGAFNVSANLCEVQGTGIVVGVDAARLSENDVRGAGGAKAGDGIVLARGLDPGGVDHCQVLGNRIRGVPGHGIAIRTRVNSGMIKHNVIAETGGGGIVMESDGEAGQLVVENNQLLDIARSAAARGSHLAGMRFVAAADLDVSSNLVSRFARDALLSAAQASVQVLAAQRVRIAGNRLTGIGPPADFVGRSTGIEIVPPFRSARITENRILRRGGDDEKIGSGRWVGLRIAAAPNDASPDTGKFFALGDAAILSLADRSIVLTTSRIFDVSRVPAEALTGFGDVGARANEIESEASTEGPVLIAGAQSCVVTDNRWALAATTLSPPSVVRSMRAIVSNNHLRGSGKPESVVLQILPPGKTQPAVLGNIRNGDIKVRTATLDEPWASLNPFSHD